MDDLAMQSCGGCRFYVAADRSAGHDGTCHRNAPMQLTADPVEEDLSEQHDEPAGTVTLTMIGSYFGWPQVRTSDWCGEWEDREP